MTEKEKIEVLEIVKRYSSINNKLDRLISSLERLEKKKTETIYELEILKKREAQFISKYKENYGEIGIEDLINLLAK